ncbi:MAG: bifunctional folylpolyglutamate synthase/dihydrofolate synthase [Desulfobacca sp.]|nr:bifunctional folylpolyglutamate synthase/dihydrofolate synthase [Desulfobacca sp.]
MQNFSSLPEATAWAFDLQKFGIKFGLSSTQRLLAGLGNPHLGPRYLHIAGTNGKGSVAAMLSAIFTQAGYPVGLYTSPHLIDFAERFRLRDQEIAPARLLELINRVRQVVDAQELPTFFEFVTAMALLYFSESQADPVILETGMGGRLDATNIVNPILTVITNIALEHQEHLGTGLKSIAWEKAGCINPGVPLFTYARQKRVLALFKARAADLGAPIYQGGVDFQVRGQGQGRFRYQGWSTHLDHLVMNLRGRHQYRNAAIALAVIELLRNQGWKIPEAAIRVGLQRTYWPGRLEVISERPQVILDGAHNPAAAASLAQVIRSGLKFRRLLLVLGVMADKDIGLILKHLLPLAQVAIFTRPRYPRAATPEELARQADGFALEKHIVPELGAAIDQARNLAGPDDLVLITGSLFTVGEAKEYLTRPAA